MYSTVRISCYYCLFVILGGYGYKFSFKNIVFELVGNCPLNGIMVFCWYVYFYIITMLLLPMISRISGAGGFLKDLLLCLWMFLFYYIKEYIQSGITYTLWSTFPVVFCGFACGKNNIFKYISDYLDKITPQVFCVVVYVLCAIVCFLGRWMIPAFCFLQMDIIYIPLFIFSILQLIRKSEYRFALLNILGKYCLGMWFIHCVFFNVSKTTWQPILYAPYYPIFVIIWGCIICFSVSYIMNILLFPVTVIVGRIIDNFGSQIYEK